MGKTIISDDSRFEWDEDKNKINLEKHGFPFEKILKVFDDLNFYEIFDKNHSSLEEERYLGLGSVDGITIILSAYTERNLRTRIISARLATPIEKGIYDENRIYK